MAQKFDNFERLQDLYYAIGYYRRLRGFSQEQLAEELGISRQGVHDLIRRCDKILLDYESKLHLVERFDRAKETVRAIEGLTNQAEGTMDIPDRLQAIRSLARKLLEEL